MKRIIQSATKPQLHTRITDKFTQVGCTNITISDVTDKFCKVDMTLPNGHHTSVTVWHDYNVIKNGSRTKTTLNSWKPSYTVNANGEVFDNGQYIGDAVVRMSAGTVPQTRKNFLIKSICTDTGDVIIRHPENEKDYSNVVNDLMSRTVTQLS